MKARELRKFLQQNKNLRYLCLIGSGSTVLTTKARICRSYVPKLRQLSLELDIQREPGLDFDENSSCPLWLRVLILTLRRSPKLKGCVINITYGYLPDEAYDILKNELRLLHQLEFFTFSTNYFSPDWSNMFTKILKRLPLIRKFFLNYRIQSGCIINPCTLTNLNVQKFWSMLSQKSHLEQLKLIFYSEEPDAIFGPQNTGWLAYCFSRLVALTDLYLTLKAYGNYDFSQESITNICTGVLCLPNLRILHLMLDELIPNQRVDTLYSLIQELALKTPLEHISFMFIVDHFTESDLTMLWNVIPSLSKFKSFSLKIEFFKGTIFKESGFLHLNESSLVENFSQLTLRNCFTSWESMRKKRDIR